MKKIVLFGLVIGLLSACGSGDSKKEAKKDEPAKEETTDLSSNPDYQKGLELVAKSDCFTCHKIDEMLTGPSYRDVANKYASYSDTIVKHLAGKIITGGTGVWGGTAFMTPHPIPEADAETMVKYILLLKK